MLAIAKLFKVFVKTVQSLKQNRASLVSKTELECSGIKSNTQNVENRVLLALF